MKKVSIIIPAYNKAVLTVKAVESVLRQSYKNIEVIVVDDGSTDETKQSLLPFLNKINYVFKKNGGACSARNAGIRLAKGDYLAFLDCDDIFLPDKIEVCLKYLEGHPSVGFVHTAAYFIDHQGKICGKYSHPRSKKTGWISDRLILGNFVCNSTVVVKKEVLRKAGSFDESIFMPADWDMWLRLSEVSKGGYIDLPLSQYRVTDNYILGKVALALKEEIIVIEKYFQRNINKCGYFGKRVTSNLHFRFAQCYFLKNDTKKFKKEAYLAAKENILNFKLWAFFVLILLSQKKARSILSKKIIRGA